MGKIFPENEALRLNATIFNFGSTGAGKRKAFPFAIHTIRERKMDVKLDTLASSRKLEETGMPGPQAGAVVEIVNDAMKDLVTKEYLTVELDRRFSRVGQRFAKVDQRFTKLESKVDQRFAKLESKVDQRFTRLEAKTETAFANLGRSQAWGFFYMSTLTIAVAALLFTALQFFSPGVTVPTPAWDVPPDTAPSLDTARPAM